jgi:L,D-transpeptidase YcbB
MPSVRLERLLASTALVALLATAGNSAALAGSPGKQGLQVAQAATAATVATGAEDNPAKADSDGDSTPAAAAPADSTDDATPAAPAADAPEESQPADASPAASGSDQDSATPAAPAAATPAARGSDQDAAAPAAPAAAAPAASGSDQDSTAPAAATPAASGSDQDSTAPAAATPAASGSDQDAAAPAASGSGQDAAAPAAPAAATPAASATDKDSTTPAAATPVDAKAKDGVAPAQSAASEIDTAIAQQLRTLADGKFDHVISGKKERTSIDAFYAARNYAPLWLTDGKVNARAIAATAYLDQVDTDGLDPADYPVPDFAALTDPRALAEAELKLTASVVTYAHHAAIGRVHWSRVSGDISYEQKAPEPADVLAAMAAAADVGAALDAYEPHYPAYLALKAKLAEIRAGKAASAKTSIANGPTLRVGMNDARVPRLRERLGLPAATDTTYDQTLAEAVKRFQSEHDLKATGTLTAFTVEALNGRVPDRPADIIIANMERWRWMPHDLGKTFVIVNLPDYMLHVMHDGKEVWKTRIVIGKPNLPTPIMSAEMKYITINPTWNVPPSIVAREYMPALQQDPTVLERMGLTVTRNPDGTVHIAQPPGDHNALGRVRFNFPNKFLVYQHDTPDKYLFAYAKRAFSHGCMRVQDPVKYADVLLSLVRPGQGYTEDRIRRMFGNTEQDIQFPSFIPVHLTYQTAFVDDAGNLEFRDDIYGRDKALLAILKSSDERKVADIPIERRENTVRREALAMPDSPLWGGRSFFGGPADGGGGFFSRLFGPPPAPVPQVQRRTRKTKTAQAAHPNREPSRSQQ